MNTLKSLLCVAALTWGFVCPTLADNIDPANDGSRYAYGENVGWVNFKPSTGPGVTVDDVSVVGYVWGANIGWVNLSPVFGGVVNDGTGMLSGYAYGQNVGWINFNPKVPGDPTHYGVTIDASGDFDGWAYGENIGWIHFRSASPVAYKVQTAWITDCRVDFDDLQRFAQTWLDIGGPGDLDQTLNVDFRDYSLLADLWLRLCPPGWPLK